MPPASRQPNFAAFSKYLTTLTRPNSPSRDRHAPTMRPDAPTIFSYVLIREALYEQSYTLLFSSLSSPVRVLPFAHLLTLIVISFHM